MPIISVEIMKTTDERNEKKKRNAKNNKSKTKTERSKGNRSYSERVRAK